jgi:hypothetical protein
MTPQANKNILGAGAEPSYRKCAFDNFAELSKEVVR